MIRLSHLRPLVDERSASTADYRGKRFGDRSAIALADMAFVLPPQRLQLGNFAIDLGGVLAVRVLMLTSGNRRTGDAIAGSLGIDARTQLLPGAKLQAIRELKARGLITIIGDGINDAPTRAASWAGVAMGGGTDGARETTDAALRKNRVLGVAELIALSRATLSNTWQNIALGLMAVFLATTLFGIISLSLSP